MTNSRRQPPGSPSLYTKSYIKAFNDLAVGPRTPELHKIDDPFRPPSPVGTPKTPEVTSVSSTVAPPPNLPPVISLPPTASNITELGKNYHPGGPTASRTVHTTSIHTAINQGPTTTVKVVTLSVQNHITKTVRNKKKSKARKVYNKTTNQPWHCDDCNVYCLSLATKNQHIKSRNHYLKSRYQEQKCLVCHETFFTPEDYKRHVHGKKHRRKDNSKKNPLLSFLIE